MNGHGRRIATTLPAILSSGIRNFWRKMRGRASGRATDEHCRVQRIHKITRLEGIDREKGGPIAATSNCGVAAVFKR